MKYDLSGAVIGVIGLGYVGLPLAEAFSQKFSVIGFDSDSKKVSRLLKEQSGCQNTTAEPGLVFTTEPHRISEADFIMVCVPTPVTRSKDPDLSYVIDAAVTVGRHMKKGSTVILESTVFPGVTEEIVKPILEKESGLKCGRDFRIGYSPERVNPGDDEHGLERTIKVVSGMDGESAALIAALYGEVAPDTFIARDIRTAEAAKVIENIQRDLNIALMNELAMIFEKMGLSTRDVLNAAATKWNFHRYSPGLVGGHCIPVDPYYLVYKAMELDYHPQVILAGRAINDFMPRHVAGITIKALNNVGKVIKGSKLLIMGLTYKENVADTRESPVKGIIKELKEFGVEIYGYDPLLDGIEDEFAVKAIRSIGEVEGIDAVVVAVPHDVFKEITPGKLKKVMNSQPVMIDIRQIFNRQEAEGEGFYYQTL
jgi:UDPglucose 6-dehydrogenase/UDP-N-acetyl-D-galactosamine dehydrogenase